MALLRASVVLMLLANLAIWSWSRYAGPVRPVSPDAAGVAPEIRADALRVMAPGERLAPVVPVVPPSPAPSARADDASATTSTGSAATDESTKN